jgi:DNA-binding response OmpR family regulator
MNKLLLIDDNPEIQAVNEEFLVKRGFSVDVAMNGADALAFLKNRAYDCIVLDVMMPDMNGYALCTEARKEVNTPIIFLSCLDGNDSRIAGLMAGGDDYMAKPYSMEELAARIYSQIRRNKVLSKPDGQEGQIEHPVPYMLYNRESCTVAIGGTNMVMSHGECEILTALMAQPGETVSKQRLLPYVGGVESTLKVYVKRIRDRLEDGKNLGKIETVFGEGYKYLPAAESGGGL